MMYLPLGAWLFILVALAGCGSRDTSPIAEQFLESGRKKVDLASAVPGAWDRVCILGPYSSDAAAREALGFDWPAEKLTSIGHQDGVSLLVFVQENRVERHIEHSRAAGDFSSLSGRCFPRGKSKFVQAPKGQAGLAPADEG